MRYLGFDVGTKRIGVAYSDDSGMFAFPESVVRVDEQVFNTIFDICAKYVPEAFVVGNSDSGTSDHNAVQQHIKRFIRELENRFSLPVYSVNEYGTSHAVKLLNSAMMGQKHNQSSKRTVAANDSVDAQAAALLLQRYLDSVKNKTL